MKSEQYLIIGGTEKAGTTSVFGYLSGHPQINCSRKKETDFFRYREGQITTDELAHYRGFFSDKPQSCALEASPGYLVDSAYSAEAIYQHLPQARLAFILRDPIARLLSSFSFHKTRLFIPDEMPFDDYVALCLAYERGELTPRAAGLDEWFLRVLNAGCYHQHLQDYYRYFPREQIRVYAFDWLNQEPQQFMRDICAFAQIDASYFDEFEFYKANATFGAKQKWLHRLALLVNSTLESFFIAFPSIKRQLLAIYKGINGEKVKKPDMSEATLCALVDYYRPDLLRLAAESGCSHLPVAKWLAKYESL